MLEKVAGYQSWHRFSRDAEKVPKDAHGHGDPWVVRYYNPAAGPALRADAWRFPAGSAVVEEDKPMPDAEPTEVTAMIKQPDGDWYWLDLRPDGRVINKKGQPLAGRVGTCILCHSQATRDMVLDPELHELAAARP